MHAHTYTSVLAIYIVSQKTSIFLFLEQLCQKLTDFNNLWCEKSWENLTSAACTVAHLTCILQPLYLGKSRVIFQQYYSYILQIIFVISEENKLLPLYPPHLKNVTALPCKRLNFFIWLKIMLLSITLSWNPAHVTTRCFCNSSVLRIGTRYKRSCSIQTQLYQPHLSGAIINRQYYRDVLLMHKLLPAIHIIAGDVFVFQQDNAPRQCSNIFQVWWVKGISLFSFEIA